MVSEICFIILLYCILANSMSLKMATILRSCIYCLKYLASQYNIVFNLFVRENTQRSVVSCLWGHVLVLEISLMAQFISTVNQD